MSIRIFSARSVINCRAGSGATQLTRWRWNAWNQLMGVQLPDGRAWTYTYDYRMRRVGVGQDNVGGLPARHTGVVFSGGLSVAEFERAANTAIGASTQPSVQYIRGVDMGGGVGGLLQTLRNPVNTSGLPVAPAATRPAVLRYNLSNGRGDIVAQADSAGALTWTASYEAYGKRTKQTGANADKQRANSKDEDPTGLLNEGFRYRDLETGVWLSRDPAGFVDGPNLYAYVQQNPWTKFDPQGLWGEAGHFYTTYAVALAAGIPQQRAFALAYHSQVPDEIDSFDAKALFLKASGSTSKVAAKEAASADLPYFGKVGGASTADKVQMGKDLVRMGVMQRGLHFLSGADDTGVTKARSNLASAIKSGEFGSDMETGLAIHALGDTYAHTETGADGRQQGYSTGVGHGASGNSPDLIQTAANRAKYNDYVSALYEALGGQGKARDNADIKELMSAVDSLPKSGFAKYRHGPANNGMHSWFVSKYGEDSMNGYDPRQDHATANDAGIVVPSNGDVEKHAKKANDIMSR